ncbi:hypothetical protein GCM10010428_23170 [Actinosynnema pretiosum subsp. pretiosum]
MPGVRGHLRIALVRGPGTGGVDGKRLITGDDRVDGPRGSAAVARAVAGGGGRNPRAAGTAAIPGASGFTRARSWSASWNPSWNTSPKRAEKGVPG